MSIIKLLINRYRYSYILSYINVKNREDILVKRLLNKLKLKIINFFIKNFFF